MSGPRCQMNVPMLVNVRHFMHKPQGVTCRVFPSVVWLQPLHDCLRVWRDAPDLVQCWSLSPRSIESVSVIEDGERCRAVVDELIRVPTVRNSENDLVEGRPNILNIVADHRSPMEKRRLPRKDYTATQT